MSSEQKFRVGDKISLEGEIVELPSERAEYYSLSFDKTTFRLLLEQKPMCYARLISRPMQKLTKEQAEAIKEKLFNFGDGGGYRTDHLKASAYIDSITLNED